MSRGRVIEYASPDQLLADPKSQLSSIVSDQAE